MKSGGDIKTEDLPGPLGLGTRLVEENKDDNFIEFIIPRYHFTTAANSTWMFEIYDGDENP